MNKYVGFDIESKDWPEEEDRLAKMLELGWEWLHVSFDDRDSKKKAHSEIMSYKN